MTLARGADDRVRDIQLRLRERGYDLLADGVAGPQTVAAILQALGGPVWREPIRLARERDFFVALRTSGLFPGGLGQSQVDGVNAKLVAFGAAHWVISWAAYGFATSYWETGKTMMPVRERGSGDGPDADAWDDYLERYDTGSLAIRLGNTPEADGDGVATAGKGDVQLTGVRNYRVATEKLQERGILKYDEDLLKTPELALRPDLSAAIMVLGMEEGWFTGCKLADFLPTSDRLASPDELRRSRAIINGRDKDDEIAAIAILFQDALRAGGWS